MRFGYWLPVFGGWLRNVPDEGMDASWPYVQRLARRSEEIGFDLTLIAELFLNDIKGIDARTVGRIVSFMGMGLAGVGGMLIGLDSSIDPLTGFRAMLPIFAAAVVGGLGSVPGAVAGALVVGVAEELSLLALPPSYKSSIAFLAILLILTLRPRGILGREAN